MSLFLSDPTDIANNIDLRQMESSLLLSMSVNKPALVKEPVSAHKVDVLANISEEPEDHVQTEHLEIKVEDVPPVDD